MSLSTTVTGLAAHTYSLNSKLELTYSTSVWSELDLKYPNDLITLYQDWAEGNGTVALVVA
jgi:hypothetical protein